MLKVPFWQQMLRLKAKPFMAWFKLWLWFKLLIDDTYLQAEVVNAWRGPRCTALNWVGLAGAVIYKSSKGFCATSGTKNIIAPCCKKGKRSWKRRWIFGTIENDTEWGWNSNCSSSLTSSIVEAPGFSGKGCPWSKGNAAFLCCHMTLPYC